MVPGSGVAVHSWTIGMIRNASMLSCGGMVMMETVCKDGDPLCTIPSYSAPMSFPSRERLRLPKQSAVNSSLPKQIILPGASATQVKLSSLVTKVSFSE
jgi:hypothetical protein